jgi:hypothetical protein
MSDGGLKERKFSYIFFRYMNINFLVYSFQDFC